ncbi:MAG: hypothetical protein HZC38_11585 [Chloroflexi bacterium]|nr:hypothetical protein [Chloroflexota bacterium]
MPPIWKLRDQWTLTHIIRVVITAAFLSSLALVIPMPSIQRAWQQSLFSPRGRKDFLNFIFLDWLTTAGNVWGLIRGVIDLYHVSIR